MKKGTGSYIGQSLGWMLLADPIELWKTKGKVLPNMFFPWETGSGKTAFHKALAIRLGMEGAYRRISMAGISVPEFRRIVFDLREVGANWLLLLDEIGSISRHSQLTNLLLDFVAERELFGEDFSGFHMSSASSEFWKVKRDLKDRFLFEVPFTQYTDADMALILKSMTGWDKPDELDVLSKATGGHPRTAEAIAQRINIGLDLGRDISGEQVLEAMQLQYDGLNLDQVDYMLKLRHGMEEPYRATLTHLANGLRKPVEAVKVLERFITYRGYLEPTNGHQRVLSDAGRTRSRELRDGC